MGYVAAFIIIVIVLMILYALLQGLFGLFGSATNAFAQFLFNTVWGWIAMITGLLSAVMFYATAKTRESALRNEEVIKIIKPTIQTMEESLGNKELTNIPSQETVIDLSVVNLNGMLREMAIAINKPYPVIFKGWGNHRLQMDIERVRTLTSYVSSIRAASDEFLELQADAIFSEKKLRHFVEMREAQAKLELDLLNAQYLDAIDRFKKSIDERGLQIKNLEAKINRQEAENKLLETITANFDKISPELRDIALAILKPDFEIVFQGSSSFDKQWKEARVMNEVEEAISKQIANQISDIERKNIARKFKENWKND